MKRYPAGQVAGAPQKTQYDESANNLLTALIALALVWLACLTAALICMISGAMYSYAQFTVDAGGIHANGNLLLHPACIQGNDIVLRGKDTFTLKAGKRYLITYFVTTAVPYGGAICVTPHENGLARAQAVYIQAAGNKMPLTASGTFIAAPNEEIDVTFQFLSSGAGETLAIDGSVAVIQLA